MYLKLCLLRQGDMSGFDPCWGFIYHPVSDPVGMKWTARQKMWIWSCKGPYCTEKREGVPQKQTKKGRLQDCFSENQLPNVNKWGSQNPKILQTSLKYGPQGKIASGAATYNATQRYTRAAVKRYLPLARTLAVLSAGHAIEEKEMGKHTCASASCFE